MTLHRFTSSSLPGSFYACDRCTRIINTPITAATGTCPYCTCIQDDCSEPRAPDSSRCMPHDREFEREDEQERATQRELKMSIEPVAYSGGPVYDADREIYFKDLGTCLSSWLRDDNAIEEPLIHPCAARVAEHPYTAVAIRRGLAEAWADLIDDEPLALAGQLDDAIEAFAALVDGIAPTAWYPIEDQRLSTTPPT